MKILFCSTFKGRSTRPVSFRSMAQHLPCEFVLCCSVDQVKQHMDSADVVLIDKRGWCGFATLLTFLNDMSLFIGKFHGDIWSKKDNRPTPVRIDVHFSPFLEGISLCTVGWQDSAHWLPVSVMDAPECKSSRDIDVFFWGAASPRLYRFRQFALCTLAERAVQGTGPAEERLDSYNLLLNGSTYRYGRLAYAALGKHRTVGKSLYALLSRAKVCPTGPVTRCKFPVGKFFENAVCGAVNLTEDFSDREALGFVHKKNIWITDQDHFIDDLTYLLEHDDIREEISRNAKEFARARHIREVRARELYEFLCERTGVL